MTHLKEVFTTLRRASLKLRADKCELGCSEVRYLGHVISGGMICPDPEKLYTVKDYPKPEKKTDVRAFLGLVGYYHQFMPKFSTIAAPLTDLTKKGKPEQVNQLYAIDANWRHSVYCR